MSLKTWKEEFYPCEADSDEAKAKPVAHSLRKWEGLREHNLKRHNLRRNEDCCWGVQIKNRSGHVFGIDSETCSLCVAFLSSGASTLSEKCGQCPLYVALGNKSCSEGGKLNRPYAVFADTGDPEPMIAALKKALKVHP